MSYRDIHGVACIPVIPRSNYNQHVFVIMYELVHFFRTHGVFGIGSCPPTIVMNSRA